MCDCDDTPADCADDCDGDLLLDDNGGCCAAAD